MKIVLFFLEGNKNSGSAHKTGSVGLAETKVFFRPEGKIVGTVMFDFRKAFDLIDHSLLLKNHAIYKCGYNFIR